VQFLKDRRGINVLSAFTLIKDFGLGLAVRTDVDPLYAPMKSRLNLLALALVGIVALAIYAQHSQVRPVLEQLVASEQTVKAILEEQSELVSLASLREALRADAPQRLPPVLAAPRAQKEWRKPSS
jgi:hypothetical protein